MNSFRRFAVYVVPTGPLLQMGEGWLGWDLAAGSPVAHTSVAGLPRPLADLTATATPYGLHATIKPPFRLAEGRTEAGLHAAMTALSGTLGPVRLDGLVLTDLDGFLALTPLGDVTALQDLAARVVRDLDGFRGPAPDSELARRRAAGLTSLQEDLLVRWGYPYVMEAFTFHITLTGRLSQSDAAATRAALEPLLAPVLPGPFVIDALALVGQMDNGRFKLIHRYGLSG